MGDPDDPNGYQRKLEVERQNIMEQDDDTGEYRIPREQDRKDLRVYSQSIDVAPSSAHNYLGRLRRLVEVLDKPLRECDLEDINVAMADLAAKNLGTGKSYSKGTKRQYLRTVKDFADFHDIEELEDIETPSVDQGPVDTEFVLSKAEVWELLENASKLRTKAIIATCWECGWRATALLSLKISDYETVNDEYGLLTVPVGVTGDKGAGGNTKPVTIARGYLDKWLDEHPASDDPDAALFCRADKEKYFGDHMTRGAVRRQLNNAADNADIDQERVYIHAFRHARTTYMKSSDDYSDMDIEHTMDWDEGSHQMSRYDHTDQDEKIASVLRSRGIEAEEGGVEPEEQDCPRCGRRIPYDARNCPYCTVRVDETPADWFKLFSKLLVEPEEDAVYSKYNGMSSATPSLPRLPKAEFERVNWVFETVLAIKVMGTQAWISHQNAGEVEPPEDFQERVDEVDETVLTDDELERVMELADDPEMRSTNVELNEVEYALKENTTQLSGDELREELEERERGDGDGDE